MGDRWFRLYEGVLNDPKLQRLPGDLFKTLINLWCLTSANDGHLPPPTDIAFALRLPEGKTVALIEALKVHGLFDDDETGLHPHNWNGRQFKSDVSTERVKRHRERTRTVSRNGDETFHGTPPDTDTEQKQKTLPNGRGANAPLEPEKDLFDRGKQVLGKQAGGQIAKLLKAKDGSVPLARAAIEQASTKQNPGEYVGAIIRGKDPPPDQQKWDPRL